MHDTIVIGGGISGLTAAYHLHEAGHNVLVLEANPTSGGSIRTRQVNGFTLEEGPSTLRVENQETVNLLNTLGLTSRAIEASPFSKDRFIVRNGRLVATPSSPQEVLATPLLSLKAKVRVIVEPFIPKSKLEDESVASFTRRRVGGEFADFTVSPFVSGIYAGDSEKLSIRSAFPVLWELEHQYGSLIRGAISRKRNVSSPKFVKRIVSFPNGLAEITDRLSENLGNALMTDSPVDSISRSSQGFIVSTKRAAWPAKRVIVAAPAYSAAQMIRSMAPTLANTLGQIEYPPVAVVQFGFPAAAFRQAPRGFGFLIPPREKRQILGCIYSSSLYPNKAPDGQTLLTIMLGGATNPEIVKLSDEELVKTAMVELGSLLQIASAPTFVHVARWERAIPQYNLGYHHKMAAISIAESQFPGITFLANYRGGVSLSACIKNATELARGLV
jgi:protoporphyrinogen/coproporphyrinogen III oxidase